MVRRATAVLTVLGLLGTVLYAGFQVALAGEAEAPKAPQAAARQPAADLSLDGPWQLATDPQNTGRDAGWMLKPAPEARATRVPWIIQDAFPGYHGVAWYWREFTVPANPHAQGRYLLRFWAVDYKADVWLNGTPVGEHEGGETPFVLDVTAAVRPNAANLLAVRVLNPTHQPIDGIVLNETPHRNKALPYGAGSAWDQGGIVDSVELLVCPAVRVEDLFARPDPKTGDIRIQVTIRSALAAPVRGVVEVSAAPAASGETLALGRIERDLPPGDTLVETLLPIEDPRAWDLNDPYLYRVTARVWAEGSGSVDERSARCGFRDFRFQDGYFRLNGRRLYLRGSHTGNCCPVGLELPHDPDLIRRDLLNVKAMRFNTIRFIAGIPRRYQLDLCDEIGLMVYEESYAAWCLADSPRMAARFDESVLGMVRRDRNHPSVVMWGLLNETPDGAVFRHAVGLLPALRALDDSRLVMLNSGRWDAAQSGGVAGIEAWRPPERPDPCVTRNGTSRVIRALGITWAPGQLAFHPGREGQYSVVRWTAPADGRFDLSAVFTSIAQRATTDVHVLHNGRALFDGGISVGGGGPEARFAAAVEVRAGDRLDCVVGFGNGDYGADTTALAVTLTSADGRTYDAAADFSVKGNPAGPWSYGQLAPGATPDAGTFAPYALGMTETRIGSLSNPGSAVWEDVLSDQHPYQRVPHTADIIRALRTLSGGASPVFVSEYGVGSAVNLVRVVRQYEQMGKADVEDAQFYRQQRDRFLADWQQWRLAETFGRPEDYFDQCLRKMAGQRLLGLNAIRANPDAIGYSLTGTVDQGMTGEGLTTTFRELKPGTVDALFDGLAPLRWCLFVEPVNVYRGTAVRLEAVLANEDALPPGEYPARLEVFGPDGARVFHRTVTVRAADPHARPEPPMVLPVLAEDAVIDGPAGTYRFCATFESGAAAAGETVEFYVADPAEMPPVEADVVLWGEDEGLAKWLTGRGIRVRPFAAEGPAPRQVILTSRTPAPPGGAAAFRALARRIAQGSTAVFLCPEVFRKGDDPAGWLPLAHKGALATMRNWVYLKDEWAKRHPIFDGLPAGGLLDLGFYREVIPDLAWAGQDPPAEAVAGGINTSQGYASGLLVAVYDFGAGRLVLNTLRIRETLGQHPAAERLLRNLLRHAARDLGTPPADLPPDFDGRLDALGYKE